jgi:hypothetical protein
LDQDFRRVELGVGDWKQTHHFTTGENMSKFKVALCVTLTVLLVGAYFMVSASTTQQAGPATKGVAINSLKTPIAYEGLRANFITTGIVYATLAAGFTELDAVDFQCGSTGATTCTLVDNTFATTSGAGVADDDRAVCLLLDGAIVGACAYDGYDAADGSYSAVAATNNVSGLAVGNHTANTLFYSTYGTTLYTFTNTYAVYKP